MSFLYFIHLFSDCPAFWRERKEALGGFYPRGLQPKLSPKAMIDFSYTPRINQALETELETQQMWEEMEVIPSDEDEEGGSAESEGEEERRMEADDVEEGLEDGDGIDDPMQDTRRQQYESE